MDLSRSIRGLAASLARKAGEFEDVVKVGLILPTSLCAGQIAQLCAQRLNGREGGWRARRSFRR